MGKAFLTDLLKRFNLRKRAVTRKWNMDESYVKVSGTWMYLYRAIDSVGDTVEFWFSEHRDLSAAKRFLRKALHHHGRPDRIVIDGSRTVTREAYLQEMRGIHAQRPDIRVIVFDHDFGNDRAWFRFMFRWTDTEGKTVTRAGMQSYYTEGGKLAETWIAIQPLGSTWADVPQPTWTTRI